MLNNPYEFELRSLLSRLPRRVRSALRRLRDPSFRQWEAIWPWAITLKSYSEYLLAEKEYSSLFAARRLIEAELQEPLTNLQSAVQPGYCWVCRSIKEFKIDLLYSDSENVNWRERLTCPTCGLNNRMRLIAQCFDRTPKVENSRIYITEHVTHLAGYLVERYPDIVTSEYLGKPFKPGGRNAQGVRHEDITSLSFGNSEFDYILSFDVLEHVPNYCDALSEFYRVLKPGGKLILTAPFVCSYPANLIRATINTAGCTNHLLPPEYHGDPVDANRGILCFYHFGWELIEDLIAAGFSDAQLSLNWSMQYGHIGGEQIIISASK
jgi:SAM-dependent methyltransferase